MNMTTTEIYHELEELAESVEYGGNKWKEYQKRYKSLKRKL